MFNTTRTSVGDRTVACLFALIVATLGGCATSEPIQMKKADAAAPVTGVWPQWRGPERDGVFDGPAWPDKLDAANLRRLWRVEIGPSYASPVVTPDSVFTTESTDDGHEIARAFDRRTGRQRWETRWTGSMTQPFYALEVGSHIRSTPTWDGERLYVGGMRDVLICLDGATGDVIWRLDFMEEYDTPLPTWGLVCSPLVADGHVYVQAGGGFVKVDKRTGEPVWRVLVDGGGLSKATFSSPVIATIAGRRQVLVQMRDDLHAVDPKTGDVLWSQRIKASEGQNILTPVVWNGGVVTSATGGRTQLLLVASSGGGFDVTQAWNSNRTGYLSTPVVVNNHAYMHLKQARLACFDLKTGDVKWVSTERFGKYCSLVAHGDRILGLSNDGTLYLFATNTKQLELIDQRKVSNAPTWAHVAPAGHNIYVRELNAIAAYEWTAPR